MKKIKNAKTIKVFKPKFSVQKNITFTNANKVAKKLAKPFDEFNLKKLRNY